MTQGKEKCANIVNIESGCFYASIHKFVKSLKYVKEYNEQIVVLTRYILLSFFFFPNASLSFGRKLLNTLIGVRDYASNGFKLEATYGNSPKMTLSILV